MEVRGQDISNCIMKDDTFTFCQAIYDAVLDDDTAKGLVLEALRANGRSSANMANMLMTYFAVKFNSGELNQVLIDLCDPGLPIAEVEVSFIFRVFGIVYTY